MRIGKSHSNISLKGNLNGYGGNFLHGRQSNTVTVNGDNSDKEYFNFKQYIITHFLNPIMNRQFDTINRNYYNFDYITNRLNLYKNNRNKEDVTFIIKVVEILKYSADVQEAFNNVNSKFFGTDKRNKLLVETSRIVLQSQYEIYNILFGRPDVMNPKHPKYEIHILNDIKEQLDLHPGILFNEVKTALEPKYRHRFIA